MKMLHSLTASLLSSTSILARRALPLLFLGAGLLLAQPCAAGSGGFNATGSLATERYYHTATLLPSGQVLVAGGTDNSFHVVTGAELYDPASGTWTATGSMNIPSSLATATLLPNGKVLVAGGQGSSGSLASAELYDPASGTWTVTGSLLTVRRNHTATLLSNGKVLVTGGYGSTGTLATA
jgi:WD40 repeat protein